MAETDIWWSRRIGRWVAVALALALAVWIAREPLLAFVDPPPGVLTLDDITASPASHTAMTYTDEYRTDSSDKPEPVSSLLPEGWRFRHGGHDEATRKSPKASITFKVYRQSAAVDGASVGFRRSAAFRDAYALLRQSDRIPVHPVSRTIAGYPAVEVTARDGRGPTGLIVYVFVHHRLVVIDCDGSDDAALSGCATVAKRIRVRHL